MFRLTALFRPKKAEIPFDPVPETIDAMPLRPYTVLHSDLPFFADPECRKEVGGACLIVLRCEDQRQEERPVECMPTRKHYRKGQLVRWDINHKRQWETAWYVDPDTGRKERAWAMAVEFIGPVVSERVAATRLESEPR
jgi:hypothetical protein